MGGMIFIPGIEAADLTDKATVDAAMANSIYWPPGTTELCGIEEPGLLFALSASTALNPYPLALFGAGQYGALWRATLPASVFDNNTGGDAADPGDAVGRIEDQSGNALNLLQASGSLRGLAGRRPKTGVRNRVLRSTAIGQAPWVNGGCSATDGAGPAYTPQGDLLSRLVPTSSSSASQRYQTGIPVYAGQPHRLSFFVSQDTASACRVSVWNSAISVARGQVQVDFSTTPPTITLTGGATDAAVEEVYPDVWRVSATIPSNSDTACAVILYPSYPTGGSDTFFGGVQIEPGTTTGALQKVGANLRDVTEAGDEAVSTLYFDGVDDVMSATITDGITGQVAVMGDGGMYVEDVTIAAAGAFTIGGSGGSWNGSPKGALRAVRGQSLLPAPAILDIALREGSFTTDEIDRLERYAIAKGGKGLLVPSGGDVAVNGSFAADTNWTKGSGWTISGGAATIDGSQVGTSYLSQACLTTRAYWYIEVDVASVTSGVPRVQTGNLGSSIDLALGLNRTIAFCDGNTNLLLTALVGTAFSVNSISAERLYNREDL